MLFVQLMSMCISDFSLTTDTGDVTHWPYLVESENSNLLVPEKHVVGSRFQVLAH